MKLDISGFDEAFAAIRRVGKSVHGPEMTDAAVLALEPVAEDARALVPVDSGDLRSGIVVSKIAPEGSDIDQDGQSVFVGPLANLLFYAGFVEFGTVKMRAQPFMGPAVDANEALVFEILGRGSGDLIMAASD